jgi:hypothetical protein
VSNYSGEGMIAENPLNPLNLVAGGLYQAASAYNSSSVYYGKGVSGAFTSWDGGRTWTDQVLPANPAWFNTSSPECNHLHLADTGVAFGGNNTVYYVDLADPIGNLTCAVATAGLNLYVTISHDGGNTWGTPIPVAGTEPGSSLDKPWIAVDHRTGTVYVAYTDDLNGSQLYIQNSTTGGTTWGPPVKLPQTVDSNRGIELQVDPFGGVDALWIDQATAGIYFARSTNAGHSFPSDTLVATAATEFPTPAPDSFRDYTLPGLGIDSFPGNGYTGRLFAVWQNGTGGASGTPHVSLSFSSDNGTDWSAPVEVNSDHTNEDFQPDVTAGPDGTVYVDWYGESATTGLYRLYGAESHDGGRTFAPEVVISDANSNPTFSTGAAWWIGDYTHIIADASGARPLWTDARSTATTYCSPCLWGQDYNISFYTAELTNVTLGATSPVYATVYGAVVPNGTFAVGKGPTYASWLVGANYTVSVPSTTTANGSTLRFGYWYDDGSIVSVGPTLAGNLSGPINLTACYPVAPRVLCSAPGGPGELNLTVLPGSATVTVDGAPLALSAGGGTEVLAPGRHVVAAGALGFYHDVVNVTVSPGNQSFVNLSLTPIPGFIVGTIHPAAASLLIDGRGIAVNATGNFNASVLSGVHVVVAFLVGYLNYSNPTVRVQYGVATPLTINLSPALGVISGTILPDTAAAWINGVPLAVSNGAFQVSELAGTYWINATAIGYIPGSTGPLQLSSNQQLPVTLVLRPANGSIEGVVSDPSAQVTVNGTPVPLDQGQFLLSLPPGPYWVNASASGESPVSVLAMVVSNNTTLEYLTLPTAPGWIAGHLGPVSGSLFLDGAAIAIAPSGMFNVSAAAGLHTLRASSEGFASGSWSVLVRAGRTTFLNLSLGTPPSPAFSGLEYPVIGAGLLALVAVGTILLLVVWKRRRPPTKPVSGAAPPGFHGRQPGAIARNR